MTRIRYLAVFSVLFFLVAACFISPSGIHAQDAETGYLFRVLAGKGARLSTHQQMQIDQLRNQIAVTDVQVVELNLNLLQAKSLTFNLSDNKLIGALTDRIDKRSPADFTWFGKFPKSGDTGSAVLAVRDGNVAGTIRAEGELYEVVPLGAGKHAILHLDESKFPPMCGDDPAKMERSQKEGKETRRGKDSSRLIRKDDKGEAGETYTIRVIFAYTPAAVKSAGGEQALLGKIRVAVDEANQSYVNSKVHAKLEIAHLYEYKHTETGEGEKDLDTFAKKGNDRADEVYALRAKHQADVGVLIVGVSKGLCGLAPVIGAEVHNAFCLVNVECLPLLTLPHEIGHLMGCRHNWEIDPILDRDHDSNCGFWHKDQTKERSWATVMSYGCPWGHCRRIPYWSSPDVYVDEIPTGSHDCCNNVDRINKNVERISNFRNQLR